MKTDAIFLLILAALIGAGVLGLIHAERDQRAQSEELGELIERAADDHVLQLITE